MKKSLKILVLLSIIIPGLLFAQNSQTIASTTGDSNQVNVQQNGINNSVYIQQIGDFNLGVQKQDGLNNAVELQQNNYSFRNRARTEQMPSAEQNTAQQYQSGEYNVMTIFQADGKLNTAQQHQSDNEGGANKAVIVQRGSNNRAIQSQSGIENSAGEGWVTIINTGILQDGNFNDAVQYQIGNYNTSTIIQFGDNNEAAVNQTGANNQSRIQQEN